MKRIQRSVLIGGVLSGSLIGGFAGVTAVAGATPMTSAGASAASPSTAAHTRAPLPTVYEAQATDIHKVIAASPAEWVVLSTPPLPAGEYLTTMVVALVLGPTDNIQCLAAPDRPTPPDHVLGVAGNGSQTNATADGGVFGNAVSTNTIKIAVSGDRIEALCRSTLQDPTKGTYVSGASITALPVGAVVKAG